MRIARRSLEISRSVHCLWREPEAPGTATPPRSRCTATRCTRAKGWTSCPRAAARAFGARRAATARGAAPARDRKANSVRARFLASSTQSARRATTWRPRRSGTCWAFVRWFRSPITTAWKPAPNSTPSASRSPILSNGPCLTTAPCSTSACTTFRRSGRAASKPRWRVATAAPVSGRVAELLAAMHAMPDVLLVLNHPFSCEELVERAVHVRLLMRFLGEFGGWMHALELNGLQPTVNNVDTIRLAAERGMPVISGGDRHCCEPNANVNLTNARSFAEFVREIRVEQRSSVLFLPAISRPDFGPLHRIHLARGSQLPRIHRPRALGGPRLLPARQRRDRYLRIAVAQRRPRRDPRLRFGDRVPGESGDARDALHGHGPHRQSGAGDSMTGAPRIALFADTFYEVNGAARTCREWDAFARRRRLPFLCDSMGPARRGVAKTARCGVWTWCAAGCPSRSIPICVSICASSAFSTPSRRRCGASGRTSSTSPARATWASSEPSSRRGLRCRSPPPGTPTCTSSRPAASAAPAPGCPAAFALAWRTSSNGS